MAMTVTTPVDAINVTSDSASTTQEIISMALRTLRLSKTNLLANSTASVLVEEKCRPIICLNEVSDHDTMEDCWIVLYDRVYDVTKFLPTVSFR